MEGKSISTNVRMMLRAAIVTLMLGATFAAQGQDANGAVYRLSVDGLACPFCAYGIEKQLSKIEGVEEIDTNIGTGTVLITMVNGAKFDEQTARQAVEAAAFTLREFEQVQTTGQRKAKKR